MGRTTAPAVAVAGGVLVYAVGYRPWQLRWGATHAEVDAVMPGDDVVPDACWTATRAVTIAAEPGEVWPWLVQMGAGDRAGWYSYDIIDNGGVRSAREVRAPLQSLAIGDVMRLTAGSPAGFRVISLEPDRSLVLAHREQCGAVSAAFTLTTAGTAGTRLVHRVRFRVGPAGLAWAVLMDAGDLVMSRRMLLGIRERAETRARRGGRARAPRDLDPTALRYDLEVAVGADPATVYAFLADVQDHTGPPGSGVRMRKRPAGPTAVGTRWHEEVRLGPGLWMPVDSVATAVDPPALLEADFTSPFFTGWLSYRVEPATTGSTLRQRQVVRPRRSMRWLSRATDAALRPRLLDRLADIRDIVESRDARLGAPGDDLLPRRVTEEHDGPRRRCP